MGWVRCHRSSCRRMDLLAWRDSSHCMAKGTGGNRRPVGKARFASQGNQGERPAQNAVAQFLLRGDKILSARYPAWQTSTKRTHGFPLWLRSIPGFLALAAPFREAGCGCENYKSRKRVAGGVRELLTQTELASGDLGGNNTCPRQGESKQRTLSQATCDGQVALHRPGKIAADSKSKPDSTFSAGESILELNEWVKDPA